GGCGFGSAASGCVAVADGVLSSPGHIRRTAAIPAARLNTADAPTASCFFVVRAAANAVSRASSDFPPGGGGAAPGGASPGFALSAGLGAVESGAGRVPAVRAGASTAMGSVI